MFYDEDEDDPLLALYPGLAPPDPREEADFRAGKPVTAPAYEPPPEPPPTAAPEPDDLPVVNESPPPVEQPAATPQPTRQAPAYTQPQPQVPTTQQPRDPQGDEPGAYAFQKPDPDKPEKFSLLDDEGAQWAALLDTLLNGGRGVGKILGAAAVQKQKTRAQGIDNDLKRAQIQHLRAQSDPASLDLQRQRLALQQQNSLVGIGREQRLTQGAAFRQGQKLREQDPNSDAKHFIVESIYRDFPDQYPRGSLDDATLETLQHGILPRLITKKVDISLGPKKAEQKARESAAGTAGRVLTEYEHSDEIAELERKKAKARKEGALAGDTRDERRYQQKIKDQFVKDSKEELDVAYLMDQIDQNGGVNGDGMGLTESLIDQLGLRTPLIERTLGDAKRGDILAAKRLILEVWGRALTGKAASAEENSNFRQQTGMAWSQDPAQVESAYRTFGGLVQSRIRRAANGNPGAFDAVGFSVTDPYQYLNVTPEIVESWRNPTSPVQQSSPTGPRSSATPQPNITNSTQSMAQVPTPREQVAAQEQQAQAPRDPELEELLGLMREPVPAQANVPAQPTATFGQPTPETIGYERSAYERLRRKNPQAYEELVRKGRGPSKAALAGAPKPGALEQPRKKKKDDDEAERLLQGF